MLIVVQYVAEKGKRGGPRQKMYPETFGRFVQTATKKSVVIVTKSFKHRSCITDIIENSQLNSVERRGR